MKINLKQPEHQDNLKMELYRKFRNDLRFIGLGIRAEYKLNNCRFDLIIWDEDSLEIVCFIEIRRINVEKDINEFGKKHMKYAVYGRLLYISKFCEIDHLLTVIHNAWKASKSPSNLKSQFS